MPLDVEGIFAAETIIVSPTDSIGAPHSNEGMIVSRARIVKGFRRTVTIQLSAKRE